MKIDTLTLIVGTFFLPVWLAWELLLLKWRGQGMDVGTISIVMKQRAYELNFIPFFWASMMAHWWFNWQRTPVWSVPYPAIVFWALLAGTLALDVALVLTHHPYGTLAAWAKVLRSPMVQCGLGILAAYFLFPQRAYEGEFRWW